MSVDTKLRDASQAVRTATQQAEYTARTPGSTPRRLTGPMLAWIGGLTILALLGVPALMIGTGSSSTPQGLLQPAGEPPQSNEVVDSFPYLELDIPDTEPIEAYDITDDETGNRVGTHIVYLQIWNNEAGETLRRQILLRVQEGEPDYPRFTDLVGLAEDTETIHTAGRDVTVYLVPDEAIEEGIYDLGVLHWIESPGIEAILIPWGLNREGALDLMPDLKRIELDEWIQLTTTYKDPTTTTLVTP